jgi:signal recognition particle subunit SRP54
VARERQKKKVLTVSCDVYRPAAIEQLKAVSAQAGIDFFPSTGDQKPADIARRRARPCAQTPLLRRALRRHRRPLAIDEAMMAEIKDLHALLKPIETLFVVDAMQGQDAVNTAKAFNEALPLTGVILTKLDGDSRGGAALSVRHVTGKPIKFAGVGEKLTGSRNSTPSAWPAASWAWATSWPGRRSAARRRPGKGQEFVKKLKSRQGLRPQRLQGPDRADEENGRPVRHAGQAAGAVRRAAQKAGRRGRGQGRAPHRRHHQLHDPAERSKPELIKASRKRRIATGAGVQVQEVNRLLNQFEQTQKMMKQFSKGGMAKMMRGMKGQ